MPRFAPVSLPASVDRFGDSNGYHEESENLLSRTFLRGFAAGQNLSSHQFDALLPTLLDQFSASRPAGQTLDVQRWSELFLAFARQRAARLAVDVSYVAEGGGI